jgi:glutathione S-transferase
MLQLYYCPQTRAIRPRWLLEEIGTPYELVRLDLEAGEHKRPAYLKLNPNGTVPTLVDDGLVLFESAAIVQYLADKFPEAELAPAVGTPARGTYYQWMHYAMSTIEPPSITIYLHTTGAPLGRPGPERIPALVPEARAQLAAAIGVIDAVLGKQPFMLGERFSAVDVMIGSMLGWCAMIGELSTDAANAYAYLNRLGTRPAVARAQAD